MMSSSAGTVTTGRHLRHILVQATKHGPATAIQSSTSTASYAELCAQANGLSKLLVARYGGAASGGGLDGQRVAIAADNDVPSTVVAHWAVWAAGGVAVPLPPLNKSSSKNQVRFTIQDSGACTLLTQHEQLESMEQLSTAPISFIEEAEYDTDVDWNMKHLAPNRMAQIVYTNPAALRGVVHTHQTLTAQIQTVADAWQLTEYDRVVQYGQISPLNYVHSMLHSLWVPLHGGATLHHTCDSLTWNDLVSSNNPTVFMATYPVYQSLLDQYRHKLSRTEQEQARGSIQRLRLCTIPNDCSNAALLQHQWEKEFGRSSSWTPYYGTTPEVGTVLSCTTGSTRSGRRSHQPATIVGSPMSDSIQVKLDGPYAHQGEGELCVQGDTVFDSYWNPAATEATKDTKAWFRTGDWMQQVQESVYRFLGKQEVDLVQVNSHQTISCLDIETVLATHNSTVLEECYIVGVPKVNGKVVLTAVIRLSPHVLAKGQTIHHAYHNAREQLEQVAARYLEDYQLPKDYQFWDSIPKNEITGQADKQAIIQMIVDHEQSNRSGGGRGRKLGFLTLMAAGAYLAMPLSIP